MTLLRRFALVAVGAVLALAAGLGALLALAPAAAVTPLPSADGQFWDIQDTSPWAQDSGGIATGGRANPFNGFGYLKLQVRRGRGGALTVRNQYLRGFGLAHDGGERFDSITPVMHDGVVVVARHLRAARTRSSSATSTACSTAPTSRARCRWRGAARPAPTTTAAARRWPRPRAATRGSTPPTRSSR